MRGMSLRWHTIVVTLNIVLLAFAAHAQTSDVGQHLQNQYQDRIFLLRGFYSSDELRYDATGATIGTPSPGFWTIDGFVLVTDAKVHGQTLVLQGRRMPVVSIGQGFQFQADSPKKRKKTPSVEIEAKLGPGNLVEEVDALTAKIFLTDQDSLVASVPSYWQTCVSAGLNENDPKHLGCRFSAELLPIPGVNPHADPRSSPGEGQTSLSEHQMMHVFRAGKDILPPRAVFSPEPQFSGLARDIGLKGTVTLGLVVDDQGVPRNIEILYPLGAGLDEQAVAAVTTWKFKPAEQKGHGPVAIKIAVQVDFH
jgi:TonB family protein